jgi:hypothetical protein
MMRRCDKLLDSKITLALGLALCTTSFATAATKHSAHLRQYGARQVQPETYGMPVLYDSKYAYDGVPAPSRASSSNTYPPNPFLDPAFIAPEGVR